MKRRILSLLLAAAMLCALLPVFSASADIILPPDPFDDIVSGTCGNLTWELNKTTGVLTISGTGEMTEAPWLAHTNSIRTVNIGEGVTSIGEGAFQFCMKLTTVTIPVSVTVIGKSAFSGCTGLTDVNYAGTPGDWNAIQVGSDNASLTGAALHTAPCPHTNTYTDHKNAACLTDGYDRTICDDCGEMLSETILPALGHDLVTDAAVPATCTGTGLTAGEHCTRCSYKLAQTVVPALGHDLVTDAAVPATCTETGLTEGCHCSRCDYKEEQEETSALGHSWDAGEITLEPTEYDKGEITFTCTRCGETKKVPIPELSHVHSYTDAVTDPTCTEQGYTTHTCSCGASYVDSYVPAMGHDIMTDAVIAPTCTGTGLTEGSHCRRCDYVETAQEILPALGHAWDEGEVTVKPTAKADGEKTFTCTRCGETKTEAIPALGECDGGADCPSYAFKDVRNGDWYHEAVDYAVKNGLMNGVSGEKFAPNDPMTRAMLVTVLWRYEGSPKAGASSFNDLTAEWYKEAVAWAAENGIVNGVGNGRFDPNGSITREQMATILYRYAEKKELDVNARGDLSGFPDRTKISGYARDAIVWAVGAKLIGGANGYLMPQGNATRAQVATILMRFIENIAK